MLGTLVKGFTVGIAYVAPIGMQLIRSTPTLNTSLDTKKTILQVAFSCFMVTWANPQALIVGISFVQSVSAQ